MPKDNLNKTRVLVPAITAALVVMAAPLLLPAAFAAPTLHGGLNCELVGDDLRCTGDISGLGGAETALATLEATAEVTTGCVNQGGNEPRGLERESIVVSDTQELNVEAGRATFDITLEADATERECPSANMDPIVVCVSFSGISLEVDPSSGPSRTFTSGAEPSSC